VLLKDQEPHLNEKNQIARIWRDGWGCPLMKKDESRSLIKDYNTTLDKAKERCATECSKSTDCEVADLYFYKYQKYYFFGETIEQACTLILKSDKECKWWEYNDSYRYVLLKA